MSGYSSLFSGLANTGVVLDDTSSQYTRVIKNHFENGGIGLRTHSGGSDGYDATRMCRGNVFEARCSALHYARMHHCPSFANCEQSFKDAFAANNTILK